MKFPWSGEPEPQLMLRVELTDGQTFTAPVEGWSGRILLGDTFVRVFMGNDESILYPMHRVHKATYYREGAK